MPNRRVVVVTPAFHRPDSLARAVDSVRRQTFRDFEHVIVKDGCPRKPECELCRAILSAGEKYRTEDERVRFVALPENKGGFGYYARNWAIEHSDAPFIAYLDDDNWWEPEHLETLVAALEPSDAMFAFSGSIVHDQKGRAIHRRISQRPYHTGIDTNELLHRRDLIERFGPWKPPGEIFDHDWELVSRWLKNGATYVTTGRATSNYQLRPEYPPWRFWYSYWKHRVKEALLRPSH
ncbi:MAG: glycosyltransferase family 2 protein [bacterium]|nr:glycosyltransferase family 2 protein [bacterium]